MAYTSVSTPAPGRLQRLLALLRGPAREPSLTAIDSRIVRVDHIGRGFADPQHPGKKRIVITVDDATFERIRSLAVSSEISLAAATRQLIDRGFAAVTTTP